MYKIIFEDHEKNATLYYDEDDIQTYSYDQSVSDHQNQLQILITIIDDYDIGSESIELNSYFVHKGINEWIQKWIKPAKGHKAWMTTENKPVKYRPLWTTLYQKCQSKKIKIFAVMASDKNHQKIESVSTVPVDENNEEDLEITIDDILNYMYGHADPTILEKSVSKIEKQSS